jgi:hypothetical protein
MKELLLLAKLSPVELIKVLPDVEDPGVLLCNVMPPGELMLLAASKLRRLDGALPSTRGVTPNFLWLPSWLPSWLAVLSIVKRPSPSTLLSAGMFSPFKAA